MSWTKPQTNDNLVASEEALYGEEEGNMDADDASSAALATVLASDQ